MVYHQLRAGNRVFYLSFHHFFTLYRNDLVLVLPQTSEFLLHFLVKSLRNSFFSGFINLRFNNIPSIFRLLSTQWRLFSSFQFISFLWCFASAYQDSVYCIWFYFFPCIVMNFVQINQRIFLLAIIYWLSTYTGYNLHKFLLLDAFERISYMKCYITQRNIRVRSNQQIIANKIMHWLIYTNFLTIQGNIQQTIYALYAFNFVCSMWHYICGI